MRIAPVRWRAISLGGLSGQSAILERGRLGGAGCHCGQTSEVFNGYMDGAVRSGERAATEVAREL